MWGMQLIQHPLIHVVAAGILAWITVRSMVTGEMKLNRMVLQRRRNPIGFWLGITLGCLLICAFGGPVLHEMLK